MIVLGQKILSRSCLFNSEHPILREDMTDEAYLEYQEQYRVIEAGYKGVVKIAVQELMQDIVKEIDRMLAVNGYGEEITEPPETFRVIRLTDEYDFCEEVVVESASGKILSNTVRQYNSPVVSRPGEWIVLPEDQNGHWLAPDKYQRMVECLSSTYNVGFADNLSAAYFKGAVK